MVPQVDFDIADSILRGLEGWEAGNKGLYRKYRAYKKIVKISKFYFGPRSPKKPIFTIFVEFLREKIRDTGITSETTIPGISSETTETQDPHVCVNVCACAFVCVFCICVF